MIHLNKYGTDLVERAREQKLDLLSDEMRIRTLSVFFPATKK